MVMKIVKFAALWVIAPAIVLAAAAFAVIAKGRAYLTERLDDNRRIVASTGVDVREAVTLGGIEQYVTIRGHDVDNPVLLYLHGGPGSALLPTAFVFQTPWEDMFTVVQWDQRGAGRTYRLNSKAAMAEDMSVERFARDTCELVDHLRARLNKEKIFVLGHSWGSILGANAAQICGEKFHAYIGLGQVVNMVDNWSLAYEFTLSEARRRGDQPAIDQLEAMGAPVRPEPGELAVPGAQVNFFDLLRKYGGEHLGRDDALAFWFHAKLWGPEYSLMDAWSVHSVGATWAAPRMWPEVMQTDLASSALEFDCPVIFMLGRWDYNTPSVLAEAYLEEIRAPLKKLIWMEHSAHVIVMEERGRFLTALANEVRPLAEGEERAIYSTPQEHPYTPPSRYTDGIRERAAEARRRLGLAPLDAEARRFEVRAPLDVVSEHRLLQDRLAQLEGELARLRTAALNQPPRGADDQPARVEADDGE